MKPDKFCHLSEEDFLKDDLKKHAEYVLPNGGRILSYHPYDGLQVVFFEVRSGALPDLWKLGCRKGCGGRYLRALICKRGICECKVNGAAKTLTAGEALIDYGAGDNMDFCFVTEDFFGAEISIQFDTLIAESSTFKLLLFVIESMNLPEEEIFNCDGYVFSYSKVTEGTLDKLLEAGLEKKAGIIAFAHTVEIGSNLSSDLKEICSGTGRKNQEKQRRIAGDIYRCLTDDYETKYTAGQFAEKYGVSDTTVKNYFKSIYGYGFKEYQTKVRMEKAAELLATSNVKIGEISFVVGYSKHTKFSKAFKNYYGITPMAYRRKTKLKRYNTIIK